MKRRATDGDEQDVFGSWRHVHLWTQRPGATSRVKRKARRRERREARAEIAGQLAEVERP